MRTHLYFPNGDADIDLAVVPRVGEQILWSDTDAPEAATTDATGTRWNVTKISWTIGLDVKQEAHLVLEPATEAPQTPAERRDNAATAALAEFEAEDRAARLRRAD